MPPEMVFSFVHLLSRWCGAARRRVIAGLGAASRRVGVERIKLKTYYLVKSVNPARFSPYILPTPMPPTPTTPAIALSQTPTTAATVDISSITATGTATATATATTTATSSSTTSSYYNENYEYYE